MVAIYYFEQKRNQAFEDRIKKFLFANKDILPFIENYNFKIESSNTFPHSTGIASSASSFCALSACFISIKKELNYKIEEFDKEVSNLSRLGSGSACRSVYKGVTVWGETNLLKKSSDNYAIPINNEVHKIFGNYHDDILIVDENKKSVSSSVGHNLMDKNPFRKEKYKQSNINLKVILNALKTGDLEKFIEIVENEALSLHSMMMLSSPSFILIKPKTLEIINKIRAFRLETKIPLCFTLDAGPNVHLLYPEMYYSEAQKFKNSIKNISVISDFLGNGIKTL
jgi:diphosphomevalonate decarboxylase